MNKILIVTHGHAGEHLLAVASEFFGAGDNFETVSFEADQSLEDLFLDISSRIENKDKTVYCLTDIPGGTPYNIAKRISFENKNIKVISGVNLAMIIQLIVKPDSSSLEIVNSAKDSIQGG